MLRMFTVFTKEIDDADGAVSEILNGLEAAKDKMGKNSIGIVHCAEDYVNDGVVKRLSLAVPFDVVGIVARALGGPNLVSSSALTLSVLTGDDVFLKSAVSKPVTERHHLQETMADLYRNAVDGLPEAPKMMAVFTPQMFTIGPDEVVDALSREAGVPLFGCVALRVKGMSAEDAIVVHNGMTYCSSTAAVAIAGNVDFKWVSVSVPADRVLGEPARVTGSVGNVITSINGVSAEDYFVSHALAERNAMNGLVFTPMVARTPDGVRLTRNCIDGDGKGGVVMTACVPVGSNFIMVVMKAEDVEYTARSAMKEVVKAAPNGALIYSCAARLWELGFPDTAEREVLAKTLAGVPWLMAYCGGEICPQTLPGGRTVSALQNNTIVACVF
ncbi:MAG: FIST C-terminal domain-containing protein [Synergistaceae bacterium]|jgi:hypothetical protein|nr:FIST C-terminal domain-containing protein [Synergistaceae bacterium]